VQKKVKICGTANPGVGSRDICPPLANEIQALGFVIADEIGQADFLICINHCRETCKSFLTFSGSMRKAALIRLEPAAVYPAQYQPRTLRMYSCVVTPGDINSSPDIPWPYYYNQNPLTPDIGTPSLQNVVSMNAQLGIYEFDNWRSRQVLLSLIASNKVSPTTQNNYKLRRTLASSLSGTYLKIYGGLWNVNLRTRLKHRLGVMNFSLKSGLIPNLMEIYGSFFKKYPSAYGPIEDKHLITSASKFSLIIENDNNYVSEKLIDALIGGSIPIYIGGDFARFGIPSELVISGLKNKQEIEEFLENFEDEKVEAFQKKLIEWLQSPLFYSRWDGDRVFASIANEIAKCFGSVSH
jgi:hypothetical protein